MKIGFPRFSIARITGLFGKTRQAFHQMEARRVQDKVNDEILLVYVQELRRQQPQVGTRKLYEMLQGVKVSNRIKMGRDKFFALLRRNDLLVKRRRKFTVTTDSSHAYTVYPNLIQEYVPTGPEQIWVSDLTYLSTDKGFVYLSLVTDQYSKKIMGYHVHPTLEAEGSLEALKMALQKRTHKGNGLIHHSDRGIQYCCDEYLEVLRDNGVQISMSSRGNPYENATAERVNGILKVEFYLDRFFRDIEQVKMVVKGTIAVYNHQRLHASCDYMTPDQAHEQHGILKKRWKNYRLLRQRTKEPEPIEEEIKNILARLARKNVPALTEA